MADTTVADPRNDRILFGVRECDGYKVLGKNVLYETLGRGGFGTVYKGRHLRLDIDVAVKCLEPSLADRDALFVTRFRREAQAAARISHQNVVRVFEVDHNQGLHYLVMEFVDGETSRHRVKRKGRLSVEEAVQVTLGAARGLAEAHEAGLVHRDVKPDNILISKRGVVKLADLGLAKPSDDQELTVSHAIMGTPSYMPPEQCRDAKAVGPQADVYAMAASLYFFLVAEDGIAPGPLVDVLKRIQEEEYPDVRVKRPDVPDGLAELIKRCVAKDPSRRPRNGAELVKALAEFSERPESVLRDARAGRLGDTQTLVSPPPARTLAQISVTLGMDKAPSLAEDVGSTTGAPAGSSRRVRGLVAAILGVVAVLGIGGWLLGRGPREREAGPEELPTASSVEGLTRAPAPAEDLPSVPSGESRTESSAPAKEPTIQPPPDRDGPSTPVAAPIEIELEGLAAGPLFTREASVELAGRVVNARTSTLTLESGGAVHEHPLTADGAFSIHHDIDPGQVVLRLGTYGLERPLEVVVVRDSKAPELEVVAPGPAATRTSAERIELRAKATDGHLLALTLDGVELARPDSSPYELETELTLVEGTNRFVLVATDRAGNTSTSELEIVRDTTPPTRTRLSPREGTQLVASTGADFRVDADEPLARARIGDTELAVDGGTARGRLEVPARGDPWLPVLVLEDDLGNSTSEELSYPLIAEREVRVPAGWEIVDVVPPPDAAAQLPGSASAAGWAWRVRDPVTDVTFLLVEAGSFEMGSAAEEEGRYGNEGPRHTVELTRGFYLAESELTQAQWKQVMETEPGFFSGGEDLPVETVSWDDCKAFCDATGYRFPTEAEWEYACRAGTETPWSLGDELTIEVARIEGTDDAGPAPVKSFAPNPWGFHDMHGNVWEWCRDGFASDYYARAPERDPVNDTDVEKRVLRGGSFFFTSRLARSAMRRPRPADDRNFRYGFRPARDLD